MAVPNTVTINGTIRDIYGELYEGAVIEVYLENQMAHSDSLIGNAIFKTYSNSYGRFSLDLVPSDVDSRGGNYYVFKIIKDTVNYYKKVVPSVLTAQDFEDLPDYVASNMYSPTIGRTGTNGTQTLPENLGGIFQAATFNGDGSTQLFTAPGEIFFVARNGVVQSEALDYVKQGTDTIEFFSAPEEDSIIALFYRI